MNLRCVLASILFAGLAGCAAPPAPLPNREGLFADAAFKPPTERIEPGDALAMSPEMRHFAETQIRSEVRSKGLREGLISALYSKTQLQLDYDGAGTRNAAQAFEARRGNCMSLVLMTAAFARYFNLPMTFNSVVTDDLWTRYRGMYFAAGHVNITLARIATPTSGLVFGADNLMTIDFLPSSQLKGQRSRAVDVSTVVAMYLSNRAAEALAEGKVDDAYWWSRAAIDADSRWLAAYNNLAVVYRHKGLRDRAEAALRLVLAREPANLEALANLSLVLRDAGRTSEADAFAARLAEAQPIPPYRYFDQGMAAMRVGDFLSARDLFRKEIARDAYVSEFHFWLAIASYGMGDLAAARAEIAKAVEHSATVGDRELYGAKQAWLNQQRAR
ncbi:hypothetical protein [Roseateles sp.]|uniref:tetratricopeptide repeat protein n=1 Tax=Roseateles sp. TaxID=1971397 RepID=UPI002DFEC037|nr:hypothetical protein [Roseateles sp.]